MSAVEIPVRSGPTPVRHTPLRRSGRLLFLELRHNAMPLLLPLAAALFWFDALRTANALVPIWSVRASVLPNHVFPDLGPFSAGVAAWMASRESRRGVSDLLSVTAWPRWTRQLATWGATVGWAMLIYAGCVAVIYGITARQATWGGPLWWPVAVAGLAVMACVTVGFVAGALFPSRFTAPLAAIGVLFVSVTVFQAAVSAGGGVTQISPNNVVPSPELGAFYPAPPDVPIVQVLFLVGLITTGIAGLGLPGRSGVRGAVGGPAGGSISGPTNSPALRRAAMLATIVGLVAGVTALGLAATSTSSAQTQGVTIPALHDAAEDRPIPFTPHCTSAVVPVCVHPAFLYELPQAASALDPVLDAVAGLPGAPVRAEQLPGASTLLPQAGMQYSTSVALFRPVGGGAPVLDFGFVGGGQILAGFITPTNPQLQTQAALAVVRSLLGPGSGADPAQQAIEAALLQVSGVPLNVTPAQAARSGIGTPGPAPGTAVYTTAHAFAALPAATRHAWLAAHLSALRAGQITLAELP
jgi:hypothetical protein